MSYCLVINFNDVTCLSDVCLHSFASGHYTAYCYNTEASSWVHCNDSRVSLCTEQEVLSSQAYILFFTRSRSMAANVQPSYSVTSPPAVDLMHPAKRVRIQ